MVTAAPAPPPSMSHPGDGISLGYLGPIPVRGVARLLLYLPA
jgi:hypothetical protein